MNPARAGSVVQARSVLSELPAGVAIMRITSDGIEWIGDELGGSGYSLTTVKGMRHKAPAVRLGAPPGTPATPPDRRGRFRPKSGTTCTPPRRRKNSPSCGAR
jgi:hypothetical protein